MVCALSRIVPSIQGRYFSRTWHRLCIVTDCATYHTHQSAGFIEQLLICSSVAGVPKN